MDEASPLEPGITAELADALGKSFLTERAGESEAKILWRRFLQSMEVPHQRSEYGPFCSLPKRRITVIHECRPAAGPQHACRLTQKSVDVRQVMDEGVAIEEIDALIGQWEFFGIHRCKDEICPFGREATVAD
jgi:hypothetical protein